MENDSDRVENGTENGLFENNLNNTLEKLFNGTG